MTLQEALNKYQDARTDAEQAYWRGYCDALSEQGKEENEKNGSVGR